jgi:serine protease Do
MVIRKLGIGLVGTVVLTVGFLGVIHLGTYNTGGAGNLYAQQAAQAEAAQEELLVAPERLSDAFRNAARILKPSVVTITSLIEEPLARVGGRGLDQFGIPPELRGMLPDELLEELQRNRQYQRAPEDGDGQPAEKTQAGMGSGVIVSSDGYILTNNHVVTRADELQVELSDGRTFKAEVVGTDDKSDVAVLKVEATGLVAAQLGDSAQMEVGDWVIAVGSPFGLDQTVTAGIISATNRQTGIISGGYEDFLQTDAAINPGNSGGPLVNLRGEVVGINTAINSRTGTNAGVGFAIPANMARRIMEDLRTSGHVVRGFIGATLGEVTSENIERLKLPDGVRRGAVIERVLDGGPADRGGLQANDVVVGLNGRPITSFLQLRNMVALTRPGDKLQIDVYRNGRSVKVDVQVGELTEDKLGQLAGYVEIPEFGFTVEPLTPQMARRLNADENNGGVLVVSVTRQGQAARLKLLPGDIIIELNGKPVRDANEFADQMKEAVGSPDFRMILQRGDQLLIVR